jgi:hypothetical protein
MQQIRPYYELHIYPIKFLKKSTLKSRGTFPFFFLNAIFLNSFVVITMKTTTPYILTRAEMFFQETLAGF